MTNPSPATIMVIHLVVLPITDRRRPCADQFLHLHREFLRVQAPTARAGCDKTRLWRPACEAAFPGCVSRASAVSRHRLVHVPDRVAGAIRPDAASRPRSVPASFGSRHGHRHGNRGGIRRQLIIAVRQRAGKGGWRQGKIKPGRPCGAPCAEALIQQDFDPAPVLQISGHGAVMRHAGLLAKVHPGVRQKGLQDIGPGVSCGKVVMRKRGLPGGGRRGQDPRSA